MLASADERPLTIARSKLNPPDVAPDVIERTRLLHQLDEAAAAGQVIAVSAPAGDGKTTLLAQWARRRSEEVLWLRLDQDDDGEEAFARAVIAALYEADVALGQLAEQLRANTMPQGTGLRSFLGALMNSLQDRGPATILVLDDLHTIGDLPVLQAIDYLIENRPRNLLVVCATRTDPAVSMARQRGRGELVDLRFGDLRLTEAETDNLVREVWRLPLSAEAIQAVRERTEGWPVALRLLQLSMKAGASATLDAPHAEAADLRPVFDFLAEEVLERQDPEVRCFLLETSILSELTLEACAAATGRADAARVLDRLMQLNLFIVAYAAGRSPGNATYRYHDLFAEFLRARALHEIGTEGLRALHRRVAVASTDPAAAVDHLLAAELWDEAAPRIEAIGRAQLDLGYIWLPARWLAELPDEVWMSRPWLRLARASHWLRASETAAAGAELEALLPILRAADDRPALTHALIGMVMIRLARFDLAAADRYVDELLETATTPLVRVSALCARAWTAVFRHEWSVVGQAMQEAMSIARDSDDAACRQMVAQSQGMEVLFTDIGLAPFERYSSDVLVRTSGSGAIVERGARIMLASIHALRGETEEAGREIGHVFKLVAQYGSATWTKIGLDAVELLVCLIEGRLTSAEQIARTGLATIATSEVHRHAQHYYLYALSRVLWRQRRLAELRSVVEQFTASAHERPNMVIASSVAAALAAQTGRRAREAERLLQSAKEIQDATQVYLLTGMARLDLASLLLAAGKEREALAELEPLLDYLAEHDLAGLLLAESQAIVPVLRLARSRGVQPGLVNRVLVRLVQHPDVVTPTGDPLTPREIEALRLIAQGATNREVAEALVVTERTVKGHVTNILRKLGAATRTEAAVKARELGLD